MAVLHGRDLLSSKWPTAIIIDSVGAGHFVPIKNPIGDFFFAIVNRELYLFNTRDQPFAWRQSMARTFDFYIYFTDNYNPVTSHIKELERILEKNDLPRYSMMMHKFFSKISKKEKKNFEAVKIIKMVEELKKEKFNDPQRQIQNQELIEFLEDLSTDEIVTPVRRVTEKLDQTFLAPDPAAFGVIKTALGLLLTQNQEVNHVEIKAKKGWMKIMLLFAVIGMGGMIGWFVYDGGYLDNIGSSFSGSFGEITDEKVKAQYPSCPSLKSAVNSGKLKYDTLSKGIQDVYNSCP
jgi:hypothetical protein